MRRRGRRRRVAGGGGSGGRNGGRIRRSRERKRRTATDLAVIKELPVKPIGLGVTSVFMYPHFPSVFSYFAQKKRRRPFCLCLSVALLLYIVGNWDGWNIMSIYVYIRVGCIFYTESQKGTFSIITTYTLYAKSLCFIYRFLNIHDLLTQYFLLPLCF